MMGSLWRDARRALTLVAALVATPVTAGGSGDATAANGTAIDTTALLKPVPGSNTETQKHEGVMFVITATATLGATKNISLVSKVQFSPNGSTGWVDASTLMPSGVGKPSDTSLTSSTPGGTVQIIQTLSVPLEYMGANTHVRVTTTPDMSAANTDTASIQAVAIFTGAARA